MRNGAWHCERQSAVNVGVNGNGSDDALGIRQIIVIYHECADR